MLDKVTNELEICLLLVRRPNRRRRARGWRLIAGRVRAFEENLPIPERNVSQLILSRSQLDGSTDYTPLPNLPVNERTLKSRYTNRCIRMGVRHPEREGSATHSWSLK